MKAHPIQQYIALILTCASLMGAETDIKVTSETTGQGVDSQTIRKDVFTRGGQTNLVCVTWTKDGVFLARTQSFYHNGVKVGMFREYPDFKAFNTENDSPYTVSYRIQAPSEAGYVYIFAKDQSFVDIFTCTNGVYYPAESRMIEEKNDWMRRLNAPGQQAGEWLDEQPAKH